MGRLVYSMITSRDGYITGPDGGFDWAAPDEEVHRYVNGLERPVATYLYGRGMYQTMRFWEDASGLAGAAREYAGIWAAADKVVFSDSLTEVTTRRTRLEPRLTPDAVRRLVREAPGEVSIGGPTVAAQALRAGLVEEIRTFLVPVVVGGGRSALPEGWTADLRLLDQRVFGNGTVYLAHRVAG